MSIKIKNQILWILGITLFEYFATFIFLNVHLEWVDDIYVMLQVKGEVINVQRGYFNLRINNYYAYLHNWLYNNIDGINWYAVSLSSYSLLCIFNVNFILFHLVSKLGGVLSRNLFLGLSLAFFVAYMIENVYLLNFTRLAVLLTYTSVICIVLVVKFHLHKKYGKWLIPIFFIFFFTGWNCRLTVVLLFLPSLALFLFMYMKGNRRFVSVAILGGYTATYLALALLGLNDANRSEFNQLLKSEKYIHNILNAFNGKEVYEFDNQRDSIKALALYRWSFADKDSVLNMEFLEKIGSNTPFKGSVLKKWKTNIKEEITKAKSSYDHYYMPALNWFNKTLAFIILIVIFPFLLLFYDSTNKSSIYNSFGFLCIIYLFITAIIIFFKMEDRAMSPLLIFTFLATWLLASQNTKKLKAYPIYALIIVFGIVGLLRIKGYRQISMQRTWDLEMKEKIRSNVKAFYSDRTVFFDLYSYTILETHPLWDENFPENWTSGREMYNLYNVKHHQNLEKVIGCADWPCFFQEAAKKPDKYLFFYSQDRIQIIESYLKIIYDYDIKFKKLSDNMTVNSFTYSLLWFPNRIGYYEIDTTYAPSALIELDNLSNEIITTK